MVSNKYIQIVNNKIKKIMIQRLLLLTFNNNNVNQNKNKIFVGFEENNDSLLNFESISKVMLIPINGIFSNSITLEIC